MFSRDEHLAFTILRFESLGPLRRLDHLAVCGLTPAITAADQVVIILHDGRIYDTGTFSPEILDWDPAVTRANVRELMDDAAAAVVVAQRVRDLDLAEWVKTLEFS